MRNKTIASKGFNSTQLDPKEYLVLGDIFAG